MVFFYRVGCSLQLQFEFIFSVCRFETTFRDVMGGLLGRPIKGRLNGEGAKRFK